MKDYTIMLPIHRSNEAIAKNCIQHLLDNSPYQILVIYEGERKCDLILDDRVTYHYWDIDRRPALVEIWNQCIKLCPTDNVIITSWRQRPTKEHFETIELKLFEGFGMVAFDGMHMFAFNKYLTTKVGWFDTGFTAGQLEDTDWWYRLKHKDIGIYVGDVSEERVVNGQFIDSCWLSGEPNKIYFDGKWKESPEIGVLTIYHEEQNKADRNFYENMESIQYKNWSESILDTGLTNHFTTFHTIREEYAN